MTNEITNQDAAIDSRDIIQRIGFLQFALLDSPDPEMQEELDALTGVAEQASDCSDWQYGETLIRHTYFTDYIKELIRDGYPMPKELNSGEWPWRHVTVDYEAAAAEAQADYTEIDFDGVTYFIRN